MAPHSGSSRARDLRLQEYLEFARKRPDLFEPGDGGIRILLDRAEIERVEDDVAQDLRRRGLPEEGAEVGILVHDPWLWFVRDAVEFPDGARRTYARTMAPERERVVAQWIEAHPAAPEPERVAAVKKIEAEHPTFPFVWLLGAATAVAVIAGARRARPGDAAPVGNRLLAAWAIAAVLALAIVIAV